MQRKLLAEILEEVSILEPEEKADHLRSFYELTPLRQILSAAFDPTVKFDVKIPEFKLNPDVDGYASNSLLIEYRRLYVFLEGSNVPSKRRTEILAQILESIDAKDAILLQNVLRKDMSSYGLTPEIVNQAFPGLIKTKKKK